MYKSVLSFFALSGRSRKKKFEKARLLASQCLSGFLRSLVLASLNKLCPFLPVLVKMGYK